jgi:hypothetical protein
MSGDCTKVELISASPGLVDCDNKRFLTWNFEHFDTCTG